MGTVPSGISGGMATGAKNTGLPVLGGQFGTNQYSPASGIPSMSPTQGPNGGVSSPMTNPVASASVTGTVPTAGGTRGAVGTPTSAPGAMSGAQPQPINTAPAQAGGAVGTGAPATGAAGSNAPANNGNPIAGYSPQQTAALQKQLNDTYGAGEGGELFSLMQNLGSNDSSYMQAYQAAMSKSTAEGLSTIQTGLGNSGVSANSSAAAIEQGDYLSGVTSQEGLQEQQLLQTQQGEAIGLTESTEGQTAAENSTSWLNTLSQVVGIGSQVAGAVTGTSGLASLFGGGSPSTIPTLSGSGAGAQLPGAISGSYAGPMPLSIG